MQQTLKIDGNIARNLYPSSIPEFQTILEQSFGKDYFSQKVTDRVKSFGDACSELGIDFKNVTSAIDSPDEAAYKQLKIIAKALNEGWEPNWDNSNEYKYYPWFNMSASGVSFCDYAYDYSGSLVGSRLCFKSRELAEYAGKQFIDLYRKFMII